jgi:hypothetical protein
MKLRKKIILPFLVGGIIVAGAGQALAWHPKPLSNEKSVVCVDGYQVATAYWESSEASYDPIMEIDQVYVTPEPLQAPIVSNATKQSPTLSIEVRFKGDLVAVVTASGTVKFPTANNEPGELPPQYLQLTGGCTPPTTIAPSTTIVAPTTKPVTTVTTTMMAATTTTGITLATTTASTSKPVVLVAVSPSPTTAVASTTQPSTTVAVEVKTPQPSISTAIVVVLEPQPAAEVLPEAVKAGDEPLPYTGLNENIAVTAVVSLIGGALLVRLSRKKRTKNQQRLELVERLNIK